MRRRLTGLLCAGIVGITGLASYAASKQALSTQLVGTTMLYRGNKRYKAYPKTKLIEQDVVDASFAQFTGDYDFWFGTLRNGRLIISLQRRIGCGTVAKLTYFGTFSVARRNKTCPESSVTVISGRTGGIYSVNSIIDLADSEDETYLAVKQGSVKVTSANATESIPAGFGNIVKEGFPPSPPIKIDESLDASAKIVNKTPKVVTLQLFANRLNSVYFEGNKIKRNSKNQLLLNIPYQSVDNKLQFTVSDINNRTRLHTWPAIRKRN